MSALFLLFIFSVFLLVGVRWMVVGGGFGSTLALDQAVTKLLFFWQQLEETPHPGWQEKVNSILETTRD